MTTRVEAAASRGLDAVPRAEPHFRRKRSDVAAPTSRRSFMRYLALCTDYDGTIANHGVVDEPTIDA